MKLSDLTPTYLGLFAFYCILVRLGAIIAAGEWYRKWIIFFWRRE